MSTIIVGKKSYFLQITPDNTHLSPLVPVISHGSVPCEMCEMYARCMNSFDLWHEQIFGLFPLTSRGLTHGKSTTCRLF